jgi:hypothetical protein
MTRTGCRKETVKRVVLGVTLKSIKNKEVTHRVPGKALTLTSEGEC